MAKDTDSKKPKDADIEEMEEALGGSAIPVPTSPITSPSARKGERPAPAAVPASTVPREVNPLFDGPTREEREAQKVIQGYRASLGQGISALIAAVDYADSMKNGAFAGLDAAAQREGFDLKTAEKVVSQMRAIVDEHKPVASA